MHTILRKPNSFFPPFPAALPAIPAKEEVSSNGFFNNYSFIFSGSINYFKEGLAD
jgi:hypothetical protein